jgi:hypothetical protein
MIPSHLVSGSQPTPPAGSKTSVVFRQISILIEWRVAAICFKIKTLTSETEGLVSRAGVINPTRSPLIGLFQGKSGRMLTASSIAQRSVALLSLAMAPRSPPPIQRSQGLLYAALLLELELMHSEFFCWIRLLSERWRME